MSTPIHCHHVVPVLEDLVARDIARPEPVPAPVHRGATVVTRPPRRAPIPAHATVRSEPARYGTCEACAAELEQLRVELVEEADRWLRECRSDRWSNTLVIPEAEHHRFKRRMQRARELRVYIDADRQRIREEAAAPDPARDRFVAFPATEPPAWLATLITDANRKDPNP
jgi:hypothetical protein